MNNPTNSTSTDPADELRALNERILKLEEAGSKIELDRLLHQDFTIIRGSGVKEDREAFLKAVPANAGRGRTADQPEVRLYGDCAVFTCVVTTTKNPDGSLGGGRFWNTRLFVRQAGEWLCVAWQVTPIP
jgi:uncharacterized protein DUF4440